MIKEIKVNVKNKPILDPEFLPAVLWNEAYKKSVEISGISEKFIIALQRSNGCTSLYKTNIFPHTKEYKDVNIKYIERMVKHLLWMKGGYKITLSGSKKLAEDIALIYSPTGKRSFDCQVIAEKIYGHSIEVIFSDAPEKLNEKEISIPLGGHLDGNRIGFDLGGSDRKCAATIDGKVVFSEEIEWNPYFQKDPAYHLAGINDTLKRAAKKLPSVDAIGGSAAGCYIDNRIKIASLFRGVSEEDFKLHVENMFLDIQKEWGGIPFIVVNDGEVTALAGAMQIDDTSVLGISMGTSEAVGYVNPDGNITDWLNELAFAPVDYRDNAPIDEWSGDIGCGVQYFSQQAVVRLAKLANIDFPDTMGFPEQLLNVQKLMTKGDKRAEKIYRTIGVYFAYTLAHYSEFYDFRNLLILGRVTSGKGGDLILEVANQVLSDEFPELADKICFQTPSEKNKRHGQAVAAASLPTIKQK